MVGLAYDFSYIKIIFDEWSSSVSFFSKAIFVQQSHLDHESLVGDPGYKDKDAIPSKIPFIYSSYSSPL